MRSHAKFLFDTDFGTQARRPEPAADAPEVPVEPTILLSRHEAELARMEAEALERGRREGRRQAAETDEALLLKTLQQIAGQFGDAAAGFEEAAGRAEHDAARLALLLARKLASALLARHPAAEIEALARSLFSHLRATPHVVVRVGEDLVTAIKPRLDAIAHEAGYAGRIVVLGEPEIALGDARIEWADGGLVRDRKATEALLERSTRLYLDIADERGGARPSGEVP